MGGWEGGRGLEIEPKGGEGPLPPPSLLSTEVVAFLSLLCLSLSGG